MSDELASASPPRPRSTRPNKSLVSQNLTPSPTPVLTRRFRSGITSNQSSLVSTESSISSGKEKEMFEHAKQPVEMRSRTSTKSQRHRSLSVGSNSKNDDTGTFNRIPRPSWLQSLCSSVEASSEDGKEAALLRPSGRSSRSGSEEVSLVAAMPPEPLPELLMQQLRGCPGFTRRLDMMPMSARVGVRQNSELSASIDSPPRASLPCLTPTRHLESSAITFRSLSPQGQYKSPVSSSSVARRASAIPSYQAPRPNRDQIEKQLVAEALEKFRSGGSAVIEEAVAESAPLPTRRVAQPRGSLSLPKTLTSSCHTVIAEPRPEPLRVSGARRFNPERQAPHTSRTRRLSPDLLYIPPARRHTLTRDYPTGDTGSRDGNRRTPGTGNRRAPEGNRPAGEPSIIDRVRRYASPKGCKADNNICSGRRGSIETAPCLNDRRAQRRLILKSEAPNLSSRRLKPAEDDDWLRGRFQQQSEAPH